MDDERFMHAALQEAYKALDEKEVPIGAVIERNNTIIGRGYNRIEQCNDATAHAEIIAIGAAAHSAGSWRLKGCTLYVTLEPCIMCLGALLQSRVDRIVYGTPDPRLGAVDTFFHTQELTKAYGYFPVITSGIHGADCKGILTEFFGKLRKNKE